MPYALITGASKGIGYAIAHELASRGNHILAVARSSELLEKLCIELEQKYGVEAKALAIDLTGEGAASAVFNWCADLNAPVTILVNNAGYGLWGRFEDLSLPEQQNMLRLNMGSLVSLTHLFLPLLRENEPSYILNVSGVIAHQPVATMSLYAASKSFVLSFSRGLRRELRDTKVKVSCLSPGPTATDFTKRARMEAMEALAEKFNMTAKKVAKMAVNGMYKGKAEIVPGGLNVLSVLLAKLVPTSLAEKFASDLYEKRLPKESGE